MRVILQRVKEASVSVENRVIGQISTGIMVLLGVEEIDNQEDIDWLVNKIVNMRIFPDDEGRMNVSALDIKGEFLVISQFTLHASTKKGNRPSFIRSAPPEHAKNMYLRFLEVLKSKTTQKVASGEFGADMKVSLINDGPVTISMDSRDRE